MSDKERETIERRQPGAGSDSGAGDSDTARLRAENLLRAAEAVIARELSSDSERFLQSARQASGQ